MKKNPSPLVILHSKFEILHSLRPLEDPIVLAGHPQARVHLMRASVARVDVEADAFDVVIGERDPLHVFVQAGIDALAAEFGSYVNALDPPDHAVAPVAPL